MNALNNTQKKILENYLSKYPKKKAPFLNSLMKKWQNKPLLGAKILHHTPLLKNTILKLLPFLFSGAELVVSNPSFMTASEEAIVLVEALGIKYIENFKALNGFDYDFFLDTGAELFQEIGRPKCGAVELTGSGDAFYRELKPALDFPVISADRTLCKQIEGVLGCGDGVFRAIQKLTHEDVLDKQSVIFGFGKIGRGLAYYLKDSIYPPKVIELDESRLQEAKKYGLTTAHALDDCAIQKILTSADIVIMATGKTDVLSRYPKKWFTNKILANAGIHDEFGQQFSESEALNNKKPCNFVLEEPTAMEFLDPTFYLHNLGVELLKEDKYPNGIINFPRKIDQDIYNSWCTYFNKNLDDWVWV